MKKQYIVGPTPVYRYNFGKGPHLLITAAIHGNEICGTFSVEKLMEKLDSGEIKCDRGTLTIVPRANIIAWGKARFDKKNLNSLIHRHENPEIPEQVIGDFIAQLIEQCDQVLDLHAFPTAGVPYVFQDYNDTLTRTMARACGLPHIVAGWPELFPDDKTFDTVKYAHSLGKSGVVVECGQNECTKGIEIGFRAALGVLNSAGLRDTSSFQNGHASIVYRVFQCVTRPANTIPVRPLENFGLYKAGETIANGNNGTCIIAKNDCGIINPFPHNPVGQEWFKLASLEAV